MIGSGSTGNVTLVEAGATRLLIDAGLGPRETAERLEDLGVDPASLAAIAVSHEHQDHARSAAALSRKWGIRLLGTRGTYAAAGFGAEEIAGYDVLDPGVPRQVGELEVLAVPIPHDAAQPVAFVLGCNGHRLGHATDLGHVDRAFVQAFAGCDAVLLESNYDPALLRSGPYPWSLKDRIAGPRGHLANEDVARYLASALGEACRTVVLAHLSQKNNHPERARMVAESALRRSGRPEVAVAVSGPEGTAWVEVAPEPVRGPRQLRLFS